MAQNIRYRAPSALPRLGNLEPGALPQAFAFRALGAETTLFGKLKCHSSCKLKRARTTGAEHSSRCRNGLTETRRPQKRWTGGIVTVTHKHVRESRVV